MKYRDGREKIIRKKTKRERRYWMRRHIKEGGKEEVQGEVNKKLKKKYIEKNIKQ